MIRIRRFAACLVALLAAAGASALAAPAAFATIAPPAPAGESGPVTGPITNHPATVHTVLVGGMPGWQIALIAAGAAVLAAALAVLADRLLSARRAGPAGLGRRAARVGSGSAA
jgi:hypothetical protein